MSEEPPSLKLKPRLAEAPATPSGEAVPAPPPVAATTEFSDSLRLRSKPRLAPELDTVASASAAPASHGDVVQALPLLPLPAIGLPEFTGAEPVIKLRPRAVPLEESASTALRPLSTPAFTPPESMAPPPPTAIPAAEGEGPKFKFKPKGSDGAPPPMAAMDGTAPLPPIPPPAGAPGVPERPKTPPPFPVLAPMQSSGVHAPLPIQIRASETKSGEETVLPLGVPISARTRPKKTKKLARFAGIAVLLAVSAGGVFFAYQYFAGEPPPPTTAADKSKVKSPGASPTASGTQNMIVAAPAKTIVSEHDSITRRPSVEQGRVDAMSVGAQASGQRALPTPLPGEFARATATAPAAPTLGKVAATTVLAPGVTTTTEIRATPEASQAFRSFVADAKVSGVYQGSPPRAFINNRLIKVGQLVEERLAISFDGIDAENRMLLFKDRMGARVSKQY